MDKQILYFNYSKMFMCKNYLYRTFIGILNLSNFIFHIAYIILYNFSNKIQYEKIYYLGIIFYVNIYLNGYLINYLYKYNSLNKLFDPLTVIFHDNFKKERINIMSYFQDINFRINTIWFVIEIIFFSIVQNGTYFYISLIHFCIQSFIHLNYLKILNYLEHKKYKLPFYHTD